MKNAQKIYYGLAIFVLMNGLFVVGEVRGVGEVKDFQQGIRQEFARAFVQTIGDQPVLDDLELVWRGVSDFYGQSSDELAALLDPRDTDDDIILVGKQIYLAFAQGLGKGGWGGQGGREEGEVAGLLWDGKFMQGEPIYNIVPYENK